MRKFLFNIPYGKPEDDLFLRAEIKQIQEEGFEGTDEFWYEISVGYPANKNRNHFLEFSGYCWEKEGYEDVKRAVRYFDEALEKLTKWCKESILKSKPLPV